MKKTMSILFVLTGMSSFLLTGCADTGTVAMQDYDQGKPFAFKSSDEPTLPAPPPTVNARHVTLTNLNLNNMGNQITTKPGKYIQATLNYAYHCTNCKSDSGNQIIIGLAHRSAQVCIYDGGVQGQGSANFELKVPAKPGKYDIRFRALQAADCDTALRTGWGYDDSPSKETTIGRIIASKKADATQGI